MPQIIPSLYELQSFLLTIVKTIEFFRVVPWENFTRRGAEYYAIYFISRRLAITGDISSKTNTIGPFLTLRVRNGHKLTD